MPFTCKDKCSNEKKLLKGYWTKGSKFCAVCVIYIPTIELRCHCCGVKLRVKPIKSFEDRQRLKERRQKQQHVI